jgi:hypothetical protein
VGGLGAKFGSLRTGANKALVGEVRRLHGMRDNERIKKGVGTEGAGCLELCFGDGRCAMTKNCKQRRDWGRWMGGIRKWW